MIQSVLTSSIKTHKKQNSPTLLQTYVTVDRMFFFCVSLDSHSLFRVYRKITFKWLLDSTGGMEENLFFL